MPVGMTMREREIMEKLFDLKKLTSSEIAYVLGCSVQVATKRKKQYEDTGTITAVKEMPWQKIKPEHREVMMKYVEEHDENKSLQQMSDYLAEETGVKVTPVHIGRILKAENAARGQARRKIRAPRTENKKKAWLAPEVERAVPYENNGRIGWSVPPPENGRGLAPEPHFLQPREGSGQQPLDQQQPLPSPIHGGESGFTSRSPVYFLPRQDGPQPVEQQRPQSSTVMGESGFTERGRSDLVARPPPYFIPPQNGPEPAKQVPHQPSASRVEPRVTEQGNSRFTGSRDPRFGERASSESMDRGDSSSTDRGDSSSTDRDGSGLTPMEVADEALREALRITGEAK
ncbi:hypothetical protein GE09DRAFT_450624 [Coniochaeta sp. 2T2.1]|nr:hypothetical protein GE09DRAFT_450624 [Coniochaeta sp. 2T2.1]